MIKRTVIATALALGCVAAQSAGAATIDLTGLGYVRYGDALSYSMPIANYQHGDNTNNGPYAIDSTPGAIKDLVVVATGAEGAPVTTNTAGLDNAYSTPSGHNGDTYFYPNPLTSRGTTGTVANNGANTWDASLASLQSFLSGDQMVIFFNNNQINAGGTSLQSLAAWARVWVTDPNGTVLPNSTFEFTNDNHPYALVTQGGGGVFLGDPGGYAASGSGAGNPDHVSATDTDFVLSGGALCVATGGSLTVPVPVPCGSDPASVGGDTISSPINHNLGADHVAYAILFPELNALLSALFDQALDPNSVLDLTDYTLHADIRLGCNLLTAAGAPYGESFPEPCDAVDGWGTGLNNGYEQIFIGTAQVPTPPPPAVPEPGTLALLGAACLAFGMMSRRRMKA